MKLTRASKVRNTQVLSLLGKVSQQRDSAHDHQFRGKEFHYGYGKEILNISSFEVLTCDHVLGQDTHVTWSGGIPSHSHARDNIHVIVLPDSQHMGWLGSRILSETATRFLLYLYLCPATTDSLFPFSCGGNDGTHPCQVWDPMVRSR